MIKDKQGPGFYHQTETDCYGLFFLFIIVFEN